MTDNRAPAGAQDVRASDEELIRQLGQAMADADAKMGATLVGYAFLREVRRALREKPAPQPQPDRAALVERLLKHADEMERAPHADWSVGDEVDDMRAAARLLSARAEENTPTQAHSRSQYKRLVAQGADAILPVERALSAPAEGSEPERPPGHAFLEAECIYCGCGVRSVAAKNSCRPALATDHAADAMAGEPEREEG